MTVVSYPYAQKTLHAVLGFPFLIGLAIYSGYLASSLDRPVLIKHLVQLTAMQGRILFGIFAIGVAFAAIVLLIGFLSNRKRQPFVTLDAESIYAPRHSWSASDVRIGYSDITDIGLQAIGRQKMLKIFHSGKTLIIPAAMLPDEGEFDDLVSELGHRIGMVRKD